MIRYPLIALGVVSILALYTPVYSLSYPTSTPSGETAWGTYRTYFDNIFQNFGSDCTVGGQVIWWFDAVGIPTCVTPVASGLFFAGQTDGDTIRFNGTDWVRNNILYNNGTAIGIGMQSPGYILDVAGTANFLGIRMPTGASSGMVLTSDAAWVGRWSSTPSISASGITWGTQDYVMKFWAGGVGLVISQFFDNGTSIGIGTATPTAGYKLDITGGDILVNTLRLGRGGGNILSNTAFGWSALGTNVTATTSVALWYGAFSALTAWAGNVAIGNLAGSTLTNGSNNILLWNNMQTPTATSSNMLNIGNWIYGSWGNIGIGIVNPGAKLEVAGQVKITGGSPAVGRALVSDATGLASWQDVTATNVTATGITGGTAYYLTKFGSGWNGLYASLLYETGWYIGLGNANPGYTLDVTGTWQFLWLRIPTGAGSGKVLTSDTTGNTYWTNSPTITANNIIGSSGYYLTYFWSGGNGLFPSNIHYNNTGKYGINTTLPQYMFDVQWSGSIIRAGSWFCLGMTASGCLTDWTDLNNIVKSTGTPHYIAKFGPTGSIGNSQLYETWGQLWVGDISSIIWWGATKGYITVEAFGSTNSSNPLLTLSENGGQECRMWMNGSNKLGSNCAWTAGTAGLWFLPHQIPKADSLWDALTGSVIFQNGSNIGIGTASATSTLTVSGTTLISGDLTVNGKIITDTIVNRTVNNVTISGSLLPNTAAPLVYRDIGSSALRWNNLYLSGQIAIAGWSPGVGKILTSDAVGLASWSSVFNGNTSATGITWGTENYITKFGTGWVGLSISQLFDNGINVGVGSTGATSKFEIWSGATVSSSLLHFRGQNNLGLGLGAVKSNQTGNANVGVGNESLYTLLWWYSNTAVWYAALRFTAAGFNNSGFWQESLKNNGAWSWNSAAGYQSAFSITSGTGNTALGSRSMFNVATGNQNIAIGYESLFASAGSAISNNIAIGSSALYVTTASNNIAIGHSAASTLTSGTNNIAIGHSAQLTSNTASNQLNIGNWIYGSGGSIGIGTGGTAITARLTLDSGTNNLAWLRLNRLTNTSPVYTWASTGLGIDNQWNVVPISNGDVVVYDGLWRNTAAPNPDPDIANRLIRYDFNKYFALPTKQSFVVSDGNGAGFNAPYFKEDGVSGICSYNGSSGTSPYDCAVADPVTGLSASPNNSFTMTARGTNYGYQIALGARWDAPLFARSGRWSSGTNYASGLYLSDGVTPTPWQKVLTVPANHIEYFYVNIGYNSQLQAIAWGGNIGMGTSTPDMRLVLAYSGTVWSTQEMMRIQRWLQGSDVNMVNAFGTPYLMIGWEEKRTNSIQTIGFGYTNNQSSQPAEIGFLTTDTTGNTQGDILFATRNVTTDTAPLERMRIFANGNVAIWSANNSAKLRVDGTLMIVDGTQAAWEVLTSDANGLASWVAPSVGTTILQATVNRDLPSIAASACSAQTFTVTGAATTKTAWISPASALTNRLMISYVRVSAANTVEVNFCNESTAAIDMAAMNFYVSVIQ